jgi:AcrR family transcriptional regulator
MTGIFYRKPAYDFLEMPKNSLPSPKQARAKDTVQRLISATDAALREGGESAVRVQDISASTGISIGSIYHHFKDRDGLIRATLAHNYARVVEADLPAVKNFMTSIADTNELSGRYDEMLEFVTGHFKNQSALERAAIVGTSAGRPLMQAELSKVQHQLNESATEVMQIAAERNMLKSHLNPRAAAMVILGLLLGRAVAELDSDPVCDEDWAKAALSAAGGLFTGPSHSQRK